jgi:hypothetical protein
MHPAREFNALSLMLWTQLAADMRFQHLLLLLMKYDDSVD